jgi:1-acyl-sn-glycerol-3-phosphate acyltransferase
MVLESWPAPIRSALFSLLGLGWIVKFLRGVRSTSRNNHELLTSVFERNQFDVQVFNEDLLPKENGFIIGSNHPHGFFDGLGTIWLGSKNGRDCRAIGRHFVSVFEPIKDLFLLIEIDSNRRSEQGQQVTEQSANFVKQGGCLAINCAGRLSLAKPIWAPGKDLPWKTGTVRIAEEAKSPIVLVFADMRHSAFRQLCQRVHPVVRALAQVFSYRFGRTQKLHMHVLAVVHPNDLPKGTPQEKTRWLQTTYNTLAQQKGLT